jgi:uncharacterized phiE125 gp8 family phage protein
MSYYQKQGFRPEIFQQVITTEPASDVVTLTQAKAHLNLDATFTDDDTLITDYITAARREVENLLGRTLITTTYTMTLDYFYAWEIRVPSSPLISITTLSYIDLDGTSQNLVEDTDFIVRKVGQVEGVITPDYGEEWPNTRDEKGAVTIVYTAGYGASDSDVPMEINVGIRQVVADLYRLRESDSCAEQYVNKHFKRLLSREKRRRFV